MLLAVPSGRCPKTKILQLVPPCDGAKKPSGGGGPTLPCALKHLLCLHVAGGGPFRPRHAPLLLSATCGSLCPSNTQFHTSHNSAPHPPCPTSPDFIPFELPTPRGVSLRITRPGSWPLVSRSRLRAYPHLVTDHSSCRPSPARPWPLASHPAPVDLEPPGAAVPISALNIRLALSLQAEFARVAFVRLAVSHFIRQPFVAHHPLPTCGEVSPL